MYSVQDDTSNKMIPSTNFTGHFGVFIFYFTFNNDGSVLRYQPDGPHTSGKAERNISSPEESELTESESHFNMLKSGSSTLQTALHPPALPSEQSSSVVNMSISVLGNKTAFHGEHFHFLTDSRLKPDVCVFVCFLITVLDVCVVSYLTTYHLQSISCFEVWILALLSVCLVIFSGCVLMVCRQPQTTKKVSFMVRRAQRKSCIVDILNMASCFCIFSISKPRKKGSLQLQSRTFLFGGRS